MPSDETADRYWKIGIVIFGTITMAYSVLIAEALLLGVVAVLVLIVLYFSWRFVRAHERIAAALEDDEQKY
jgi:hypothetical protein